MHPPIIQEGNFVLKPYQVTDEVRFLEICLDDSSIQFMGGNTGIEEKERALFYKIFDIYASEEKRWFWIWGIFIDDVLVGHFELKESENTEKDELEIVYMIHPEWRRKGIASQALNAICSRKDEWKKEIIATVHPNNSNSITLLRKRGIYRETKRIDEETGEPYWKYWLA